MKCLFIGCMSKRAIGGLCSSHHHYAYVILADKHYRNHTVPQCPEQAVLL